jgi:transposase
MELIAAYQEKYERIFPELTERTRRLLVASDAKLLGHGGIQIIHKASGVSRKTIARGIKELNQKPDDFFASGRSRRSGGGRKRIETTQPGIKAALLAQLDTKGDPMRTVVWTTQSVNTLTESLQKQGFTISNYTVYYLLREEGYSLKPNKKNIEGTPHEDRDVQFQHINKQCEIFEKLGNPIISIDCKKKEQIGNFKNNGKVWTKKGREHETNVNVDDFRSLAEGLAAPYGIYDILHKQGFVNVGIDHDTAAFAVESIRRWWRDDGKKSYPHATGILTTADGGGSNGVKNRLFKRELQAFVNEIHIPITLCHFPRAMSKWNVIEHQLFSFISINWRAKPLTSLAVILELISHTTTKSGLKVTAMADTNKYPTGIKVSKKEFDSLNIKRDDFHGEWNYTIVPQEM